MVPTIAGLGGSRASPMRSWFARCRVRGTRLTTRRAKASSVGWRP